MKMKKVFMDGGDEEKAVLEGEFEFTPIEKEGGFNPLFEDVVGKEAIRLKFRGELL
jgi:hypothetical protein